MKLADKNAKKDFGGSLEIDLKFSVATVSGKAGGGKVTEDKTTEAETTIR